MDGQQTPSKQKLRYNLLFTPHKLFRKILCDFLIQLGRTNWIELREVEALYQRFTHIHFMLNDHSRIENEFMAKALSQRGKNVADWLQEHEDHEGELNELKSLFDGILAAVVNRSRFNDNNQDVEIIQQGYELYLKYASFVGQTLLHFATEENVFIPLMWETMSDADLIKLQQDSIGPNMTMERRCANVNDLYSSIDPQERLQFSKIILQVAPGDESKSFFERVKAVLSPDEWNRLRNELGYTLID